MSQCKNKNFFSEIGTFFQKDADNAIQAIINAIKAMKLTDARLGLKTKHNARTKTADKLLILLVLAFFGCKHVSDAAKDTVSRWAKTGYNTLYRMMRDGEIDWRRIMGHVAMRVLLYIDAHCEKSPEKHRCLVVDDTDIVKSGMKIEKIGKIFSHTEHRHILGFKGLLLGWTDGVSFHPIDFSLHGEKGKDGSQGLSAKQRKRRKHTEPEEGSPSGVRHAEYLKSKISIMIEMIRRVRIRRMDFDYLLIDSWFMCIEVVQFVVGLKGCHHVLGMLKSNINNFEVDGEILKTGQMVKRFKNRKHRCRKYKCEYIEVDTFLGKIPVKLFLCRRTKQDGWKTILTTNTSLSFVKAYEIYAMRWSIEVCFKECKQYLNLESNQSQYFNSQIAHVAICFMQYNLLSLVKRVKSYETLGALFRGTKADTIEITLYERILLVLKEILKEFADYIGFPNKQIVQKFLSDKEILTKLRNSKCLKSSA